MNADERRLAAWYPPAGAVLRRVRHPKVAPHIRREEAGGTE
ncbi:MAG: hypothetical protein O8C66_05970 [Candidatus Methanoperedens sp.]|nr:hypothetical protein [Candidatus Methanoperedens sp.]MCZ7370037.1 hypothetical protein [Candidatus Methanoperedens sp.]